MKLDFKEFCKDRNQKNKKIHTKFVDLCMRNKNKITFFGNITNSLVEYIKTPTPLVLALGGFQAIKEIYLNKMWHADDLLSETSGWRKVSNEINYFPQSIFISIIRSYPNVDLSSAVDRATNIKIYSLPFGEVAIASYDLENYIYFNFIKYDVNVIVDFLVSEKLKSLNSNFISFYTPKGAEYVNGSSSNKECFLISEQFKVNESLLSIEFSNYIKKCNEQLICRSILFYGPPGTGKTTLSQTIADKLGYKTLKVNINDLDINEIKFLIQRFKFEAIIMDDFDQIKESALMLDFLEEIRLNVKVIIATANTLKDFNSAIIRPGRFDQIVLVDKLDEQIIKQSLGNLSEYYFEKVKHWPIAYINELKIRNITYPLDNIENHFLELNKRVNDQLSQLKT